VISYCLKNGRLALISYPERGLSNLVWPLTPSDRNSSPNIKSIIESKVQSTVQSRVQSPEFRFSTVPRTSVRESPACTKSMQFLTATLKCICNDPLTESCQCIVVVRWTGQLPLGLPYPITLQYKSNSVVKTTSLLLQCTDTTICRYHLLESTSKQASLVFIPPFTPCLSHLWNMVLHGSG